MAQTIHKIARILLMLLHLLRINLTLLTQLRDLIRPKVIRQDVPMLQATQALKMGHRTHQLAITQLRHRIRLHPKILRTHNKIHRAQPIKLNI